MATIADNVPDRQVSIGRVLGRAFATIGGNPVTTLGIALLFSAVPQTLLSFATQSSRTNDLTQASATTSIVIGLSSMVVGLAFYAIVQGSLVRATIDHEEGRRTALGESIMAGLTVAIPLILMAIVSGLGMMIGLVLLVVPGIMLYVMWSVSSPALVDERLGVFGALGRSRELTRGYRWRIFGMELVLGISVWIVFMISAVLMVAGKGFSLETMATAQESFSVGSIIGSLFVQTLISAVWGVCHASLFVELRNAKDGPSHSALADVFR